MFNVYILTDIEMPFIGRANAFCVLDYARSQSNKTVQHAFVREFSKQSPTAMQIWSLLRKFKEEDCLCRRKETGRPRSSEDTVERVRTKCLANSKEIVTTNKFGNPDSTNNSFAHPEETLDNHPLQATSRSGHNGRGQAKAQTELTCDVSQVERILNM